MPTTQTAVNSSADAEGVQPMPPTGAIADDWQPCEGQSPAYRLLSSPVRGIDGRGDVRVMSSAAQLIDGTIDDGSKVQEPPCLYLDINSDRGLSAAAARQLAAVLVAGADEIERWAGVDAEAGDMPAPARPLDAFPLAQIVEHVARRVAARAAGHPATTDPARITPADCRALLGIVEKAMTGRGNGFMVNNPNGEE